LALLSPKKKVSKSKTKREAVPPATSEFVLQHELPTVDLNLVASPSNALIPGNQIPLQPSINPPQVRLTKKGTPDKRLKSNRNLKRKFEVQTSVRSEVDPKNFSPIRKQIKLNDSVVHQASQESILICLQEWDQQLELLGEIENLKNRVNTKETESRKELDALIFENNSLRKQIEAQMEGYDKFSGSVKEAISYIRQELETFRANEVMVVNSSRTNELEAANRLNMLHKEVETLRTEKTETNSSNNLKLQALLHQLELLREHTRSFEQNVLRDAESYLTAKVQEFNIKSPSMETHEDSTRRGFPFTSAVQKLKPSSHL